jgi:dolichyl-phosphate beta-glucosyltransferase
VSEPRPALSVVIPAYDEGQRLREPLLEVGAWLAAQPWAAEIVVVDDGSRDDTAAVAREVGDRLAVPVEVLRYERNRGKGFALKVGFARARGERILFSDADLSTPIQEAPRLLERLDAGYDVAIGSRWLRGADVRVYQPWYRVMLGSVFTLLVRLLLARVSDATCGFKAYRGPAGRELFARSRIPGWSFDAELLCIARRLDLRVAEVPVAWSDVRGSKVSLSRDVIGSLLGLLRIRSNLLRGLYARPEPADVELEVWSNRREAAS